MRKSYLILFFLLFIVNCNEYCESIKPKKNIVRSIDSHYLEIFIPDSNLDYIEFVEEINRFRQIRLYDGSEVIKYRKLDSWGFYLVYNHELITTGSVFGDYIDTPPEYNKPDDPHMGNRLLVYGLTGTENITKIEVGWNYHDTNEFVIETTIDLTKYEPEFYEYEKRNTKCKESYKKGFYCDYRDRVPCEVDYAPTKRLIKESN